MEDWNWITEIPFNFEDIFTSETRNTGSSSHAQYTTLPEQNTGGSGSRDCLLQGTQDGAQFTGQMLNTENILPAFPSQNMVIPPGISPTTLIDSAPAFLSNSIAQPSSSTGNFSHVPNGSSQSSFASSTFVPPYNQSNEDFFRDMYASTFGVSNEVSPTNLPQPSYLINQVLVQPEEVHPPQSLEHSEYNTMNQHMDLSNMDALGVNLLNQNTYYNVGANLEAHNALDEQLGGENAQTGNEDPNVGRASAEDGYSWKQVNGSEHPRYYHKCSYPGCHVKKRVVRSAEGDINDISYKGLHNHPKPLPGQNISLQSSCVLNNMLLETGAPSGTGTSTYTGGDPVWQHNGMQLNSGDTPDGSSPFLCEDNDDRMTHGSDGEGDESESKKRKTETSTSDMSDLIKPMRGPRVVVQTNSDVDLLDDGYRWRKYGQKTVKGNSNPRSYYKCSSGGCSVKKHIERSANDQNMVITTYDGVHYHEVPIARYNRHNYSSVYNDLPNESHQVHSSMAQFQGIPPLAMSARPPIGTYQGFGSGFNPRDLSNQANGGMQPNQGRLSVQQFHNQHGQPNQGQVPLQFPVHQFLRQEELPSQGQLPVQFPVHQFLTQQGTMNVGSLMLPREEPREEHASNPGLN